MLARPARTALALALTGCALCAMPALAGADAVVTADRACYPGGGTAVMTLTGSGFIPNTQYTVSLDDGIITAGTADSDGTMRQLLPAPTPPVSGPSANDQGYRIEIRQAGDVSAKTTLRAARVFGDFNPGAGNPLRLKVRFSAFGFGVGTAAGLPMPIVYVHYVDPRGKLKQTISLGRGSTPCGTIKRTALRRLFPFRPRSGKWALQFDTQQRYVKGTARSRFLFDRPTLTITSR